MIRASIPALGLVAGNTPKWRAVAQRVADMLHRLPGMKLAPDFALTTERKIQHIEASYLSTALVACGKALTLLRATTPANTGKTAADWSMHVRRGTDETVVSYQHPDVRLIKMLNYGTRPHAINPVRAKALRFEIGGKVIFARYVFHPGTRAYGFLQRTTARLNSDLLAISHSFRSNV